MLRQHERSINYLQRFVDFILSFMVWYLVFALRFYVFSDAQQGLEVEFLKAGILIAAVTVHFFSREGLYKSHRLGSMFEELGKILKANSLAVVCFVVLMYFISDQRHSRLVMIFYFIVSNFVFWVSKFTLRSFLKHFRSRGKNLRHVLLIGNGSAIESFVKNIMGFKEYGIKFSGWSDSNGFAQKYNIMDVKYDSILTNNFKTPDAIVIGYQGAEAAKVEKVLRTLHHDIIPISVLPDLSYSLIGCQVDYLAGIPAFNFNQPHFSIRDIILKRFFDIVASGVGLIVLSPLYFVIAFFIRLSSPGPIFYSQERVGIDGKKFKMWKFRSMRVATESVESTPGWTIKDDPRRTRIGIFIRGTSIDELPQLWNVFIGEMSLVGPRPEQPYYVERFRREIPAYMLRHKMKAGITGWAQVNGWRGDTSLQKRIECDLYYIRHWSMWFDIKIVFMTLWRGLVNKNAY